MKNFVISYFFTEQLAKLLFNGIENEDDTVVSTEQ